jgi:hypothetical protein
MPPAPLAPSASIMSDFAIDAEKLHSFARGILDRVLGGDMDMTPATLEGEHGMSLVMSRGKAPTANGFASTKDVVDIMLFENTKGIVDFYTFDWTETTRQSLADAARRLIAEATGAMDAPVPAPAPVCVGSV